MNALYQNFAVTFAFLKAQSVFQALLNSMVNCEKDFQKNRLSSGKTHGKAGFLEVSNCSARKFR
ncbi:hypothetical protein DWQ65_02045 [Treponema phagedenis]|nr:hypothetical protein C5O78_11240 [Treponema phagedenis]QSH98875.1 hypothetical protein DWQ65_02045 [Treponema phagedenis]